MKNLNTFEINAVSGTGALFDPIVDVAATVVKEVAPFVVLGCSAILSSRGNKYVATPLAILASIDLLTRIVDFADAYIAKNYTKR